MTVMRTLLKNKIILAAALILLAVTLLSIWRIHALQAEEGWDEELMKSLDWVIPPGVYAGIVMEEVDGQLLFRVDNDTVLNEKGRSVDLKGLQRMHADWDSIAYHSAGYGIVQESLGMGEYSYRVESLDGEVLYDAGKRTIGMTEEPGYILLGDGSVVSLENGKTVYTPKEGEAVSSQIGDYWIMTVTFPWRTEFNTNTLLYLRNLDFSVALDGMLFTYIGDIEGDRIVGKVLEGYDYYGKRPEHNPRQPELPAAFRVLDGEGNVLFPLTPEDAASEIFGVADGCVISEVSDGSEFLQQRLHFVDNLPENDAYIDLPKGMYLQGMSATGYISFRQAGAIYDEKDDRYHDGMGIMNRQGDIIVPPVFSYVRRILQDCAVVELSGEYGVIRIGGGRDEG